MQYDDLRAELIRQFPVEVLEVSDGKNEAYYSCPTCGRAVSLGMEKCSCNQVLSWKNIQQAEASKGENRRAVLEFDVPSDFTKGNCRKCPISYIGKNGTDNIYECPLNMRSDCKLKIKFSN